MSVDVAIEKLDFEARLGMLQPTEFTELSALHNASSLLASSVA